MEFLSPLRYPGGKAKVAGFFQQVIKENNLLDGIYIEPYVGGGSVALNLLFNEYVRNIVINDKDISIYAFWYSVLNFTDELCKLINDTPINMDVWHEQRAVQSSKDKEDVDLLTLGFSTFFMNRTNRSGIISAGVIGGNNQTGNYKIDARYNKENLIYRIKKIAEYADRIKLYNEDAVTLMKKLTGELSGKTIIYFDPPYFVKGQGLYLNYYNENDHKEIANAIENLYNCKWIVTYDNVTFIKNLYSKYRIKEFELNYSASNSGKGKEVMIFSDDIIIPKNKIFSKKIKSI